MVYDSSTFQRCKGGRRQPLASTSPIYASAALLFTKRVVPKLFLICFFAYEPREPRRRVANLSPVRSCWK